MTLTPEIKAQIFTVRNDLLKKINEALHFGQYLDAVLLLEEAIVMSNKIGENQRAKEYNQKMSECIEKIFSIDDQSDLDPGVTADLKSEVERLTRSAQELVQKQQFQDAINDYRNAIEISIKLKDKMAIWKLTKSITLLGENLSPSELLSTTFTETPVSKEPETAQPKIPIAVKPANKEPETAQPKIPFAAKPANKEPEVKRPEILFPTKPTPSPPPTEKPAARQLEVKQSEIPFAVKPEPKRPEILFPAKSAPAPPPTEKPAARQPEVKQPEIPFAVKPEPKRPEILFPAKSAPAPPPTEKPAEVVITTKPSTPVAPVKEMPFFKAVIPQKAPQEPEGKKENMASSKDSEKKLRKEAEKREIERKEMEKKEAERKQAEKKQGKKEAEKKQSKAEVKTDTPKIGLSSDVLSEIKGFKHDELDSMPPPSTPGAQKKPTASKSAMPSELLDELKKKAKK
ncbi:MAG: hypothetical protein LUQ65_05400 [Candidatus Helarchaeota archaeon]|nr:hypothetical protein [Candidatus Helarchaeota archaeon]